MQKYLLPLCVLVGSCAFGAPQSKPPAWKSLSAADNAALEKFADDYKHYLDVARTALSSNEEVIRMAKAAGFTEYSGTGAIQAGQRFYVNNRDRAVMLFVIGQQPIVSGLHIVGTHHDSPHIDLKPHPVIDQNGIALFKTQYYGGIKKYQWSNLPLALVGRISREDGTNIDLSIGLKPGDPVFVIPDNAPHSDAPLRTRTYTEVLKGEELEPVAASTGDDSGVAAGAIQSLLKKYQVSEDDLISSELQLVPNSRPSDVGLDHALIGSFGQDDRGNSFLAARSLIDLKGTPRFTSVAYLTNFEEEGSGNNTGAGTEYFFTILSELISKQSPSNNPGLRSALHRSWMISADMNDGINPIFGEQTSEKTNAARVGYGPTLKIYGGQFDPPSETLAAIRAVLDRNHIPWQTQTPRVDVGGGGTIGRFFSARDMNVIDMGVPLLSMHSPYEMSSKVDLWYFYRFMSAFYLWDEK
ncbi:MAG: peptidase M18 [Acidobacteriales bacterium]|nr:peptidase M18 [Terriglobales bacterium]